MDSISVIVTTQFTDQHSQVNDVLLHGLFLNEMAGNVMFTVLCLFATLLGYFIHIVCVLSDAIIRTRQSEKKNATVFYISFFLSFVLFCFVLFVRLLPVIVVFNSILNLSIEFSSSLCVPSDEKSRYIKNWLRHQIYFAKTKLHESAVRARTLNFQRKIHEIHGNAQRSHLSCFHFRAKRFLKKIFLCALSCHCSACCSGPEIIFICIRF